MYTRQDRHLNPHASTFGAWTRFVLCIVTASPVVMEQVDLEGVGAAEPAELLEDVGSDRHGDCFFQARRTLAPKHLNEHPVTKHFVDKICNPSEVVIKLDLSPTTPAPCRGVRAAVREPWAVPLREGTPNDGGRKGRGAY